MLPSRSPLLFALALLAGCTSYEEEPAEPLDVLRELNAIRLAELDLQGQEISPVTSAFDAADGLTVVEAAAVAVHLNPTLLALRADVGVAEAQLVEAGLLPDPVIGWDAMDAVAGLAIDGKAESPSWLSGFGLSWDVPRPGEIDAKEGVARAELVGTHALVLSAEWRLVRDVHLGYLRLLAARTRVAQLQRLGAVVERSSAFFRRARENGAATALEDNLAQVVATQVKADQLASTREETQARLALTALLGLPPTQRWVPQSTLAELADSDPRQDEDPSTLVTAALGARPDLRRARADYRRAEERLRLEIARQWPQISIGTGISIELAIFSCFNDPAIQTALRARTASRQRLSQAVHAARAEVHAALADSEQSRALLSLYEATLTPRVSETLRLTERAFQAREITPVEILTAQRQTIEAQARVLNARRRCAESRVRLNAACGRLLPSLRTPTPAPQAGEEESP